MVILCDLSTINKVNKKKKRKKSSATIGHILASYSERITQKGVINTGLFYHQLSYCIKQIKFRLFRHYIDLFEQESSKLDFPNYQNYNDSNEVCNDFIQKIMSVIDKVVSMKERWINFRNGLIGDEVNCR